MPAKNVLVTGEDGFVGKLLVEQLRKECNVSTFNGDVTDVRVCERRLQETRPEVIFHLAALSLPKQCEENPELAKRVNVEGTRNIADAALELDSPPHLIFMSTAQVYDAMELGKGDPVDELCRVKPQNLYAETKLAAEQLLSQKKYDSLVISVFRLFNHVHKSQLSATFMNSVYRQMLELKAGGSTVGIVTTGNLDIYRELNAIQSLIDLLATVSRSSPSYNFEIFNVCSGNSRLLRRVAEAFAEYFELSVNFQVDKTLLRSNDPVKVVGDNSKIKRVFNLSYPDFSDLELVDYFCRDL